MDTTILLVALVLQFFMLTAGHYGLRIFLGHSTAGHLMACAWGTVAIALPWTVVAHFSTLDTAILVRALWVSIVSAGLITTLLYVFDGAVAWIKTARFRARTTAQQ